MYCVLSFDIRGSRKVKDRMVLQESLKSVIEGLNRGFPAYIVSGFSLTAGDEFQGVLRDSSVAYDIFKIVDKTLGFDFYCGVGIGEITTEISDNPSVMDGPAFHRSRAALDYAKKKNLKIYVLTGKSEADRLLNLLLQTIHHIEKNRTRRQNQIISYFRNNPKAGVEEAAEHFGISRQAVYKILKKSGFHLTRKLENLVRAILSKPLEVELPESTGVG